MDALLHLEATRAALNAVWLGRGREAVARRLELHPEAAQALCWIRQAPAGRCAPGKALVLGFDEACPGRCLPRLLRSPLDASPVPVRAVRGGRHGLADTWVRAQNRTHTFLEGSLGAILRDQDDPARLMALTAGHVVGAGMQSMQGDLVGFAFHDEAQAPIAGRLIDWHPRFDRPLVTASIDAGIADVSAAALEPLAARAGEWPVGVTWPFGDDQPRLRTRGGEIAGGTMERMSASLSIAGDNSRAYRLVDVLCWATTQRTEAGDSGAPIWNTQDELIAIHAGAAPPGSALNAVAIPIGPILAWAGATVVRRGEPLLRPALPRGRAPQPLPKPAGLPWSATEADILARTMWGEARGEPDPGLAAVGHVVLNRVAARSWWGRTVPEVCQKPWQFSCWNERSPGRGELQSVDASHASFARALAIAGELLALNQVDRARADPTAGATHYYARKLISPPAWARGKAPCARIGGHDFFKDIA